MTRLNHISACFINCLLVNGVLFFIEFWTNVPIRSTTVRYNHLRYHLYQGYQGSQGDKQVMLQGKMSLPDYRQINLKKETTVAGVFSLRKHLLTSEDLTVHVVLISIPNVLLDNSVEIVVAGSPVVKSLQPKAFPSLALSHPLAYLLDLSTVNQYFS